MESMRKIINDYKLLGSKLGRKRPLETTRLS
jgi:hypothetical protein